MKEYELDNITLMGGWYISNKVCSDIIKFMKKQTLVDGMMYAGSETNYEQKIVTDMKESKEMAVDFKNENEPFHTYKQQLDKVVKEYLKKYPYMNENTEFALRENYNLQKYPVGGGFKIWHHENKGSLPVGRDRHLTFMTYLNDVEDGGTVFFHQNLSTPAKKGLTLIWPAYWTHTHRGIVSRLKEKYIVTGWINFINQL